CKFHAPPRPELPGWWGMMICFSRVFHKRGSSAPVLFANNNPEQGQSPLYLNNHVYNTPREE
ncbi:MAG: hypothetical protein ACRCU9_14155, partial [Iodobacter sp.]